MLRIIFYFLGVILIFITPSCKKEPVFTTVKGRVVDNRTGEPIVDALVWFSYREQPDDEFSKKEVYFKTSINGEFTCTFRDLSAWPKIEKDGYLGKELGNYLGFASQLNNHSKYKVTLGTTLDIGDQVLYRNDGVFKIILANKIGVGNSITGVLESNIMRREVSTSLFFSSPIPIITDIPEGEERALTYNIPADDWVTIYWGDKYFGSTQFAPNIDSFYVNKMDTAVYRIEF